VPIPNRSMISSRRISSRLGDRVRGFVRGELEADLNQPASCLVALFPRGRRRIDRPHEAALAQLSEENGPSEQLLEDADRKPDLLGLVARRIPTPRTDGLVEVRLSMGRRRVDLRGRDVFLAKHAKVAQRLEIPRHEEPVEGVAVLFELLREGANRPLPFPNVGDDEILEIPLRNEHRPRPYDLVTNRITNKRFQPKGCSQTECKNHLMDGVHWALPLPLTPPFFFWFTSLVPRSTILPAERLVGTPIIARGNRTCRGESRIVPKD